jgi:hypothetical protein
MGKISRINDIQAKFGNLPPGRIARMCADVPLVAPKATKPQCPDCARLLAEIERWKANDAKLRARLAERDARDAKPLRDASLDARVTPASDAVTPVSVTPSKSHAERQKRYRQRQKDRLDESAPSAGSPDSSGSGTRD